jgi:hypothetical protein
MQDMESNLYIGCYKYGCIRMQDMESNLKEVEKIASIFISMVLWEPPQ